MSTNDSDFWRDSYTGAVEVGRLQRQTIGKLVGLLEEFLQFERGGNGELGHVKRAREAVAAQKTATHSLTELSHDQH